MTIDTLITSRTRRSSRSGSVSERYAKIVDRLTRVEDVETKAHVIELIENGFAPFSLASLGKPRNRKNNAKDETT